MEKLKTIMVCRVNDGPPRESSTQTCFGQIFPEIDFSHLLGFVSLNSPKNIILGVRLLIIFTLIS